MKIIQWEYTNRTLGENIPNSLFISDRLNHYGVMGWELVCITSFNIKGKLTQIATFKRPCGYLEPVIEFELRNPGEDSP